MEKLKTLLKNFLLISISLNEIFLGSLLLSVYFLITLFKGIHSIAIENIGSLISALFIMFLFFYAPLYSSAKVIFSRTQSRYNLRSTFFGLSIWGTIWLIILLSIGFITVFGNLVSVDLFDGDFFVFSQLGPLDYILIFHLFIYFIKILLLFFFSGYLKIERFGVVHVPMSRGFLILVSCYSLYLLWKQPFQIGELPVETLFYFFQSVGSVYATGSLILQAFYFIRKTLGFSRGVRLKAKPYAKAVRQDGI